MNLRPLLAAILCASVLLLAARCSGRVSVVQSGFVRSTHRATRPRTHRKYATNCPDMASPRRDFVRSAGFISLVGVLNIYSEVSKVALADVAADSGVQIGIPVGQYLPASPKLGFFRFTPAKDSTPSIRGRVLNPFSYTLDLPGNWKAITVGVIQTGDFCQPKCDEPWTEVKFEGSGAGKVKVMMVPTFRLTPTEKPSIEEIGDPAEVIQKLGPFITGDYYDEEDMPTDTNVIKEGGRTYYQYIIDSPGAVNGPHNVATITTIAGPTSQDRYHAIMVVGSATNADWGTKGSADLLAVAQSFKLT